MYWVSELDATVWLLVLRQVGHLVDLPSAAIGLASRLSAQPSAAVAPEPLHCTCTWLAAGLAG